jgi:hypothetical protein
VCSGVPFLRIGVIFPTPCFRWRLAHADLCARMSKMVNSNSKCYRRLSVPTVLYRFHWGKALIAGLYFRWRSVCSGVVCLVYLCLIASVTQS